MPTVEFQNITKRFGDLTANDDISLTIKKNTVHCILGENGAGKSTLMNILFGLYKPDAGKILINGIEKKFKSPLSAIKSKIGMLHQHFKLIDDFTVFENVILGKEVSKGLKLNYPDLKQELLHLIIQYNLELILNDRVSDISISEQQKVEIVKLLYRDSELLIFDEPTAVLSPIEVERFYNIIGRFKSERKTIILITHKLKDVMEISDRVSVLRKGKLVYEADRSELDIRGLSREIVGDIEISDVPFKSYHMMNYMDTTLELKDVSLTKNKVKVLDDLNLELRKGEIHGIAGVEGNGQSEIVDVLFGIEKTFSGTYEKFDKNISLVPDDRIKKGLIKEYSIGENFILKKNNKGIISNKLLDDISREIISKYDIRVKDVSTELGSLSGGNQQKVVFAREIELDNTTLLLSHPTRGVDINATAFIHSKIISQRNSGKAILLISSDLDELLTLSDRLSVLYKGKILRTLKHSELKSETGDVNEEIIEKISKLMLGITK
jgi:simple sugar transport system ATP-binding protein